ncbi:hypothetical protein [Vreelandella utahensis]|uniref:hypothetical protein n=1 Tax=Vreelandella halophila TaxID=86177 RepID=UPI000986F101|nr:hypothetical protein [Halomonas utahensis]
MKTWQRALLMVLLAMPVKAQDDAEGIRIQGVDERPGVMHLMPWRLPRDAPMEAPRAEQGRLGDLLSPLDDQNYRRYLRYRSDPGTLLEALPGAASTGETR